MPRLPLVRSGPAILAGIIGLFAQPLSATPDETPTYDTLTSVGTIGTNRLYDFLNVRGGTVVEVDAAGNYYYATGPKISKYNAAGVLQWSQFQTPKIVTELVDGMEVKDYYDLWQNHLGHVEKVTLASGKDEHELGNAFAQKIALDGSGDVFVSFLDVMHRDRSLLARFDGTTGDLEWVARSQPPFDSTDSAKFVSMVLDLLILPDGAVAVLESGIGTGRFIFTRLVIFEPNGSSLNGAIRHVKEFVRTEDGGTNFRNSIGVGMALTSAGNLVYATFEGASPATLPIFPDPYPAADKLILRSLAAPYNGTPVEVIHDSTGIEKWYDLEIGPLGRIFIVGTDEDGGNHQPVLAAFDPTTLTETMLPRKTYLPTGAGTTSVPFWESEGFRLFSTGTQSDDALYITSGTNDFRSKISLNLLQQVPPFPYSPTQLSVIKVNGAGLELWKKYESRVYVHDAFTDPEDNLYFIAAASVPPGISLLKYSSEGVLQIAKDVSSGPNTLTSGRFSGAINAAGDIAVAFPRQNELLTSEDLLYKWYDAPLDLFGNPGIAKKTQSISFDPVQPFAYVGNTVLLYATSSSALPVSFEITAGADKAEFVPGGLKALASGTVTIRALQPGSTTYQAATPVSQSLLINRRPQSISFAPIANREFTMKDLPLVATSTSGLPVTFAVSGAGRNYGGAIDLKELGTVKVVASQAGNNTFNKASPVTVSFQVTDNTPPKVEFAKRSIASTTDSTSLKGVISDNFKATTLQHRVKPPGGTFGKTVNLKMETAIGASEKFSHPVQTKSKGSYAVEFTPIDKAGNKGSAVMVMITRK